MRSKAFVLCFVMILLGVLSVAADDNSCFLSAPAENDVWVIVHDADAEGDTNGVIWQGKIMAGQKVRIQSTSGNIRYDYRTDPDDAYGGDVSVGCYGEQSFIVE